MPKRQFAQQLLLLTLFFALSTPPATEAAPTEGKAAPAKQTKKDSDAGKEEKAKADAEHDSLEFKMLIGVGSKRWEVENFAEATKYYREALDFAQKHFAPNDMRIAQSALYLGRSENFGNNNYPEACKAYELSRDVLQKIPGDNSFILGDVLFELACVYAKQGRVSDSDPMLAQAMGIYNMTFGPDDNHVASVLHRQGKNLISEGKPEQAIPLIERAVHIFEKKQTWTKLASSYADLADAYGKMGKSAESTQYKQKADQTNLEHPKAGDARIE